MSDDAYKGKGAVVRIGDGNGRPEDALSFLNEAIAAGARGVVIAVVTDEGIPIKFFGNLVLGDLTFIGAAITREAFE